MRKKQLVKLIKKEMRKAYKVGAKAKFIVSGKSIISAMQPYRTKDGDTNLDNIAV